MKLDKLEVIDKILSTRKYECERCGCKLMGSGGSWGNPSFRQFHHKKYKRDGGNFSEENIELICLECHREEHNICSHKNQKTKHLNS